ncbi:hypothetical protein HanRHA438_Chr11g0523201 [Helianthus annuus]|nr:hypothetical protein HanRHA438_Chr11g0523201 [Helianthus annuus]
MVSVSYECVSTDRYQTTDSRLFDNRTPRFRFRFHFHFHHSLISGLLYNRLKQALMMECVLVLHSSCCR